MIVLHDALRESDLPKGAVVTIGNFDGMHVGHQRIISGVVERARELGTTSAVITFQPHPLTVVAPDRAPQQIMTLAQKEELVGRLGADALLVIAFTPDFSCWSAGRFVEEFLVRSLHVREVHIGRDFCFGAGKEGRLDRLKAYGEEFGFGVVGVEDITIRGIRVSSSLLRRGIERGDLRAVSAALARPYFLDGRVVTGRRLGRKIGFPTVNVDPTNELFPGSAVYVTTCQFETFGRDFMSVTNIGVRPTLYENYATTIESHVLDFDSNVYGDTVRVHFHRLLRREKQFRSAIELTRQIKDDIERARRWFLRRNGAVNLHG
jgi:riboflavin kinase / FMN adenylyltransferase